MFKRKPADKKKLKSRKSSEPRIKSKLTYKFRLLSQTHTFSLFAFAFLHFHNFPVLFQFISFYWILMFICLFICLIQFFFRAFLFFYVTHVTAKKSPALQGWNTIYGSLTILCLRAVVEDRKCFDDLKF